MKINKNIVTNDSNTHANADIAHRMTIDEKKLEVAYKRIAKDKSKFEKILTFQGVSELDEYIRELTKL